MHTQNPGRSLCRGRAIHPDQLRDRLLLAPNARVKLDDLDWQQRLLDLGIAIRPRAFIFDPLARMKDAHREENDQTGMAPVIEYLRLLRDVTQAATLFVHHTGHTGEHMRGTSDLESAWESRLSFKRDGDSGIVTVKADHRDESPEAPCSTDSTGTTRPAPCGSGRPSRRSPNGSSTTSPSTAQAAPRQSRRAIEPIRADVDRTLAQLEALGTT